MGPVRTKVKRPLALAASLVRALGPGAEGNSSILLDSAIDARLATSFNGIMGDLAAMGEPLYQAAPPTGFPEISLAWASAGSVLIRVNLAQRLVGSLADPRPRWGIAEDMSDAEVLEQLEAVLLPGGLQPNTRRGVQVLLLEGLLAGATPEQRIRAAASALLATPDFLLH